MSVHAWEDIVKQIEQEEDSARIAELAKKLNDAMVSEEMEKVKRRLGISRKEYAASPHITQPADVAQLIQKKRRFSHS